MAWSADRNRKMQYALSKAIQKKSQKQMSIHISIIAVVRHSYKITSIVIIHDFETGERRFILEFKATSSGGHDDVKK